MYESIVKFIRELYREPSEVIPLHEPRFVGNEKKYLAECIDTSYVSSIGKYVLAFEQETARYTGSKYAVAAVNGTAALHIALMLAGVKAGDEVLTQPLTFIATANAIHYTGARPVFLDVDPDTLGLSPASLQAFIEQETLPEPDGYLYNKRTGKRISACVPMHTFGHPCRIDELKRICDLHRIALVEDAAESLGSLYKNKHTGTFGRAGVLSYNGNKTITTGGGGMIITDDEGLAIKAKHLTTQAKVPHRWEYVHDHIGYNYRLTNLQAALGVAQMESLDDFVREKRKIASAYAGFFKDTGISFFTEPQDSYSNYWLNVILLENRKQRDEFLAYTNDRGIMTRPAWTLMNKLEMYKDCQVFNIHHALHLEDTIVNIPSSVIIKK
jgi:aminotransferase in exopolysaccharide biosynthesis